MDCFVSLFAEDADQFLPFFDVFFVKYLRKLIQAIFCIPIEFCNVLFLVIFISNSDCSFRDSCFGSASRFAFHGRRNSRRQAFFIELGISAFAVAYAIAPLLRSPLCSLYRPTSKYR